MKSNTNIFTQASLKSSLKSNVGVVTAILVVCILAINPESLMTPAHAIPQTTIITPSVENEVTEGEADSADAQDAQNGVKNSNESNSEGTAVDMFSANPSTSDTTMPPSVKTLADNIQAHSESELSQANQNLLTENAKLQREINDLETQVNVLVAERGGQLFLYGAGTALASFIIGGLFALLLFGRRRDSRY